MKYLKKIKLSENIDFLEYAKKELPLDIQETLTDIFYAITDYGIRVEISKGTMGGYQDDIGINIGNKFDINAIKFNFDETYIVTILEVIDYLESKGRKLEYFWYRDNLKGIAKHVDMETIYSRDIEKYLRNLPNKLYFINFHFTSIYKNKNNKL